MKDMYLDYNNRNNRRDRGNRTLIIVVLIVLALGVGVGGYFLTKYYIDTMDAQEQADREAEAQTTPAVAETITAEADNNQTDVFGLWYPAEEETPEITVYPGEEVWMPDFVDTRERVDAKGIYISSVYLNKKLNDAIGLVDRTELNAMVIDIKSDAGYITYRMDYDVAKEIGAVSDTIYDINATVKKLKEHNIYLIARVVTLKDPILAERKPELALYNTDGTIFRDKSGLAWVNPYNDGVWDYLVEVCRQCIEVGFDEVNLDYIRFSTDAGMSHVDFGPGAEERSRIDVITDGVRRICEEIKPMGGFVSCDVYGSIITSTVDAKIVGQSYFKMAKYLDYICPMVYPSHYANGYYNLDYPDCHPYELVYHSMLDSNKVLYMIDPTINKAEVRPWLQDFTASWVSHHLNYGVDEVRGQINAVYDAGHNQWLLWNAGINYTEGALLKAEN